ncbi:hypothetical protein K456DRAFT_572544 [Colletotrichum gloeosporioides 23]|nr:hypothetical protein K456DRAFT_572544 [Colletotrichum gloeosporioides 23]
MPGCPPRSLLLPHPSSLLVLLLLCFSVFASVCCSSAGCCCWFAGGGRVILYIHKQAQPAQVFIRSANNISVTDASSHHDRFLHALSVCPCLLLLLLLRHGIGISLSVSLSVPIQSSICPSIHPGPIPIPIHPSIIIPSHPIPSHPHPAHDHHHRQALVHVHHTNRIFRYLAPRNALRSPPSPTTRPRPRPNRTVLDSNLCSSQKIKRFYPTQPTEGKLNLESSPPPDETEPARRPVPTFFQAPPSPACPAYSQQSTTTTTLVASNERSVALGKNLCSETIQHHHRQSTTGGTHDHHQPALRSRNIIPYRTVRRIATRRSQRPSLSRVEHRERRRRRSNSCTAALLARTLPVNRRRTCRTNLESHASPSLPPLVRTKQHPTRPTT